MRTVELTVLVSRAVRNYVANRRLCTSTELVPTITHVMVDKILWVRVPVDANEARAQAVIGLLGGDVLQVEQPPSAVLARIASA